MLCRQRCRTTIEDFVCTYFPLYGLDPSKVRNTHGSQGNGTRTHVSSCPRARAVSALANTCLQPSCEQDMFRYLDILLFVEATIYQMDEENEALCEALTGAQESTHSSGSGGGNAQHTFQGQSGKQTVSKPQPDQQRGLVADAPTSGRHGAVAC